MPDRPRLLDLFCGAGGAAVGYARAGFDVVGVDVAPQPRYPFEFRQADAIEYLAAGGWIGFDAIHASPPCQRFSIARHVRPSGERHPDLIAPTRAQLQRIGRPYVIENVAGAPLSNPIRLCGTMFGLQVIRHRLFESNLLLCAPSHTRHETGVGFRERGHRFVKGWRNAAGKSYPLGDYVTVTGHNFEMRSGSAAMGIDWMAVRRELAQAIPPAYTECIGAQLLRACREEAVA